MKVILGNRLKYYNIIGLILVFASGSLAQIVSQSLFQIKQGEQHSSVVLKLPDQWGMKLLNKSPAIKILLKIYHKKDKQLPDLLSEGPLPDETGFKQYRLTPLTPASIIFVFELKEKMQFEWHPERANSLIIHDEHYYDESEWFYRKGLKLHEDGKLNAALSEYRKAVFKNRQHGNAYFKAGQIRFKFQQYRLAEIDYKHALRLQCDSLNLYPSMAKLYEVYGQLDKAQQYLQIYQEKQNRLAKSSGTQTDAEKVLEEKTDTLYAKRQVDSLADSSETIMAPGKGENKVISEDHNLSSKMPVKTIAYSIGIAVFGLFIILYIFLVRLKKRKKRKRDHEFLQFEPFLDYHKEKILQAAKQASEASDEHEISNDEPIQQSQPDDSENVSEKFSISDNQTKEETNANWESFEIDESYSNTPEVARSLNLGIGELELALNLKAQQRLVNNKANLQAKLEEMHNQNVPIPEIARQLNLGQGEIELLLALQKRATAENDIF